MIVLLLAFSFPLAAAGQNETGTSGEHGTGVSAEDGPMSVFVSVLPQTYFVERLGGERVEVTALVPPGRGPTTYEPTPRQVTALGRAEVYFSIGVPFEGSFMPRVRENLPELLVVDTTRNIQKRYLEEHAHGDEEHELEADSDHDDDDHDDHYSDHDEHEVLDDHDEHDDHYSDHDEHEVLDDHDEHDDHGHDGAPDPHVWLGPEEVLEQIAVIRDTLIELDPTGEEHYQTNHDRFAEEIRELEAELSADLATLRGETFFVYHPSFGYFADTFGLEQVAIETGGDEPTPAQLQRIIREAQEAGVQVVFVQPQFSQTAARRVAEAIGGTVVPVDHLNPDWFETMRTIAQALQEGL